MEQITRLFESNRRWVERMTQTDPDFFRKRAVPAEPHFLFIGCSDSRVPADSLTVDGVGSEFPGYVPDHAPDGGLDPAAAAQNRKVIVEAVGAAGLSCGGPVRSSAPSNA